MIDIHKESLLSMSQAARSLPHRPNTSTLWRWHASGVRGIRLETVLVGGQRFTSREALQRFVEQSTAAAEGSLIPSRTCRQREKAIERAKQELAAAGI